MKVNANIAPDLPYMVQRHPQKSNMAIVTLYNNIETIISNEQEMVQYEQYTIIVPWKDNLAIEVAKNLENWIASAQSL